MSTGATDARSVGTWGRALSEEGGRPDTSGLTNLGAWAVRGECVSQMVQGDEHEQQVPSGTLGGDAVIGS